MDILFRLIKQVYFQSKMGKTRFLTEEMDGKVFDSRQSTHISFVINMTKVLFPTLDFHLTYK